MKKSVSIIAAAAMAASLTMTGAMSCNAAEDAAAGVEQSTAIAESAEAATEASAETPTEAATVAATVAVAEEPTATPVAAPTESASTLEIQKLAGKWKLQVANGNTTVDIDAKDSGTVVIGADGTFTVTDLTGKTVSGTVSVGTEEIGGTVLQTVALYSGDTPLYAGYYSSTNDIINIGNGGQARLIRDNGAAAAATTAAAAPEATTSNAAATTKAAVTTVKAATTANSGSKTDSPKTGVAFPALPAAGLTVAAAAIAFAMRKKED